MENCILFFLGFEMIGLLVENIIGSEVREFGFIINWVMIFFCFICVMRKEVEMLLGVFE